MSTPSSLQSPRTTLKRLPQRGDYDRATVLAILDEGLVAHVGFVVDGQPYVLPMAYGRIDDRLYLHGALANRMLRTGGSGALCVTVTLLDGLVVARSAFHHSMNYRTVVLLGQGVVVDDPREAWAGLEAITDHVVPGRWKETREPNAVEMKRTLVVRVPITEASAKLREGGPIDDVEDLALPVWAGQVPLRVVPQAPIPCSQLADGIPLPASLQPWRRPSALR